MSIVPDLQRRHFEYIAAIIKALPGNVKRSDVAAAFAKALQPTNVNFKRGRFVIACEPAVGEIDEGLRDLAPDPKPEPELVEAYVEPEPEPEAEPDEPEPEPELALSDLAALLRKELK
jgi:hypothetical protein